MKNIIIPVILASTLLMAGMFAFMPVEKATSVHGTLLAKQNAVASGDSADNSAVVTIVPDSSKLKRGFICIKTTDAGGDSDADLELAIEDDLGLVVDLLDSASMEDAGGECVEFAGYRVQLATGGAGDTASFVAMWSEQQ